MTIPNIKVRGIRSPIPEGHILGRIPGNGTGDAQLIPLADLAAHLTATGAISAPGSGGGGAVGHNPTATASDTVVNGSATTFMRSDAAPPVQKASSAQFGLVKVDGTSITAASGVISGAAAANPTATAGPAVVNGSATTFMRSDGAPAIQKASSSQFGIVEVDGTSITASGGVISAAAGAAGRGIFAPILSAPPTQASTGLTSWYHQTTSSTVSDVAVGVQVYSPSNSSAFDVSARTVAAPVSTPYKITVLLTLTGPYTDYSACVFGWSDGTKFLVLSFRSDAIYVFSGATHSATPSNLFQSNSIVNSITCPFLWVQIEDDGTNAVFSTSRDGVFFTALYSATKSTSNLGASGFTNIIFGTDNYSQNAAATLMSWSQS